MGWEVGSMGNPGLGSGAPVVGEVRPPGAHTAWTPVSALLSRGLAVGVLAGRPHKPTMRQGLMWRHGSRGWVVHRMNYLWLR